MGRSPSRSCSSDDQGVKKGPWTPEEDEILIEYIRKHSGHGSWSVLPMLAGLNRCGKSCRLRWTNYLRPDLKRGHFSHDEQNTIINLHSALGNKWSQIAAHLPGRTDNEIKNFWNTHLRKKLVNSSGIDLKTRVPMISDLNNFLVDFSQSMISTSNLITNLMMINPSLGNTLMTLLNNLSQPPAEDLQFMQTLWQLISTSTNIPTLPSIIEENSSLLQLSSYNLSQCGGLLNWTSKSMMDFSPEEVSEVVENANLSTYFGGEYGKQVPLNDITSGASRLAQGDSLLPSLVSACSGTSSETINGVKQIDPTFVNGEIPLPNPNNMFDNWEAYEDDVDGSGSFWKDFIY